MLPRQRQPTVAWGRARDGGPARRPRLAFSKPFCTPGRGAGMPAEKRCCAYQKPLRSKDDAVLFGLDFLNIHTRYLLDLLD